MDDTLGAASRDLSGRDTEQALSAQWRKLFDRICTRRAALTMLMFASGMREADVPAFQIIRDEHTRLAIGLAKLLWRVE